MHTTLAKRIGRLVTTTLSTALVAALVTTSFAGVAWAEGAKKGGETATALAQGSAPAPKAKPAAKAQARPQAKAKPKSPAKATPHAKPRVVASNTHAAPKHKPAPAKP